MSQSARQPRTRLPFAAAVVALFASVFGVAKAVEFDERVQAPRLRDATELRSRSQAYSERDAQVRAAGLAALIGDRDLAAQRFEMTWDLQRAIDAKQPLGDLSQDGIVDRGDGSYKIDQEAFPQWRDPVDDIAGLLPAFDLPALRVELIRRGMTPGEVDKLGEYIASGKASVAANMAALPIAVSFSRVVKKYDKLKRPVPDSLVLSYIYQREKATSEARRRWATGLLAAVGPNGTRVLQSYLGELKSSAVWGPSDQRAGIDGLLANLRLPDFEQKIAAEAKGVSP